MSYIQILIRSQSYMQRTFYIWLRSYLTQRELISFVDFVQLSQNACPRKKILYYVHLSVEVNWRQRRVFAFLN